MASLQDKVDAFLAQKRIAVAGASRSGNSPGNIIYKKLKSQGYEVFPVNPNAGTIGGETCYPDVKSIPGGVEGVVIVAKPEVTEAIVEGCAEAGVQRIWMHRSFEFAGSSVSEKAVALCEEKGIEVIAGACPMMFCEPVDVPHKCLRGFLRLTGALPA